MTPQLKNVLALIDSADAEHWRESEFYFENVRTWVEATGRVRTICIGLWPFTWNERRSIARAFARKHKALTLELARQGREAVLKARKE